VTARPLAARETPQPIAALWLAALLLCCCDPKVLIGYVPDQSGSSHDAATMTPDVGRDAGQPEPLPKVSWPSGVHSGNDLQAALSFETWRGRPLDLMQVYPDRAHGWDGIVSPGWPVDMLSAFSGKLVLSVPLYPDGQGNNQDCASGAYDAQWRKLGTFLVAHDRPDAIVRLGWGPNDLNHSWRADPDPADWISCFRHSVSALRATAPSVRIDWSFNPIGAPNITTADPYTMYPGDAYVDFVGIEAFDRYPPSTTRAEWNDHCNAPTGLCSVISFARRHGKKLGIAEWGVASCGGDPGGDNPFFIQRIVATFAANLDVMGYEAYFEDGGGEVCSNISDGTTNPKAAARYKEIYRTR
jgi:hypothetical protein